MTKEVRLTNGGVALVDDDDYEALAQFKWRHSGRGYAIRTQNPSQGPTTIWMHRVVAGTSPGMETDHVNGIKLDNRRCNLRTASCSENRRNIGLTARNTSGYKGVSWRKDHNKWSALIKTGDKYRHLGYYDTPEEAAAAYDQAAREHFGEFAWTNDRKG